MKYYLVFAVFVAIYGSIQCVYDEQQDIKNYVSFTLNSYRKLSNVNKNFLYSPLSLGVIYNILYQASSGNGESKLKEVLFADSSQTITKSDVFATQRQVLAQFSEEPNIKMANNFYLKHGVRFDENFKNTAHLFQAATEYIDFSDSRVAVNVMNNWVTNQTNGTITKLLKNSDVGTGTEMVIINTVYFQADWLQPFTARNIHHGDFESIAGSLDSIDYIEHSSFYDISSRPEFSIDVLQLPYQNGFKFWIILPHENYELSTLIENLTADHIKVIGDNFVNQFAQIKFPIFTVESTIDGKKPAPDAFKSNDFRVTSDTKSLVDKIIQKSKIIVNTNGTEASSATAATMRGSVGSRKVVIYFTADRPFLYAIMTQETHRPIFIGHYSTADPNL